ncbi:ABC transporter ATP-binding protein [Bradyrhizobium sp. LHD-71]|uniref:ABC transporter ATP-binding protein n=1 Tax=Bradyrhizobium sp. LHD-71 TaxID=3072141 RepID=UPI00280C831A|nr:ABC transporter ATP-binding protein [Bradyrhizobium sp. LHD-71]MDQ8728186.1 ABC transporter ATP-binding protein [Bradyrhizobium sp. LHD-71]
MTALLNIDDLSVFVATTSGALQVTHSVHLGIGEGETVCLVGESGSGKTMTAHAIMRLVEYRGGTIASGSIRLDGRNLATLSQKEMSALRGDRIGIIFQEPMTAFDPVWSIGEQIGEVLRRHRGLGRAAAREESIHLLDRVRIPDAHMKVDQFPHQLSGGMRQRAMIAMALACAPRLLIADEPTTALDVTIQAQVLKLLQQLQAETGMAILLITHDLGIAAEMADRVVVMYAGRVVEDAPVERLFANPVHPYTRGLLRSVVGAHLPRGTRLTAIPGGIPSLAEPPSGCSFHPRCARASDRCTQAAPPLEERPGGGRAACWHPHEDALPALAAQSVTIEAPTKSSAQTPLIEVEGLHKHYPIGLSWPGVRRSVVRAVDGVDLHIHRSETFALVGESGCGKSTLARVLLQLERASAGAIRFDGEDLTRLGHTALRRARRHMQMVFQDPYGSIDPRWTVGEIIGEPLRVHEKLTRPRREARVRELLERVGLDPGWGGRYPHQLSGGQRQRIAIARAIAVSPRFVLADEAVSALDVSVQAQVINLMEDLKERLGLTYLFISHGLHVVRHISDRIGVMYLGRIVETGPAEALFRDPAHPYTKALIAAIPEPDPAQRREFVPIVGEIPSPSNPPSGCRFHTRCPIAQARCRTDDLVLTPVGTGRAVACHFPL